jgi:Transposase DDE domain group 1
MDGDDACAPDRALRGLDVLRRYAETRYAAKSWRTAGRRVIARIEGSSFGLDIRFVVIAIEDCRAEHIYDTLYCACGQAENLIKLHKAQLKSDRTSCRSANANQMRLIPHTAAIHPDLKNSRPKLSVAPP